MTEPADGRGSGRTAPPAPVGWDVVDLLGEIDGIGGDPVRGGYSRHVFEPAELELRDWFTRRARALGLAVAPDRNA
jgi:N-carbamoyl-L-amino-acid hydrolase